MVIKEDPNVKKDLSYEQLQANVALKKYLQQYLGLPEEAIERISLLRVAETPEQYQAQLRTLADERLNNLMIGLVPDDLWFKGDQPSESNAEQGLILFKRSYFEAQDNPDEIAWLSHELAHCQKFLDSESPEKYQQDLERLAFADLSSSGTYPNNPVEEFAFTKQFQYLKEAGKSKDVVLKMIEQHYMAEDLPFFVRLLDDVFGK